MPDKKTTAETVRSPIDGTELVRLATSGSNWQATLSDIFDTLGRVVVDTATDYYVNPSTGSDSNDGSIGSPFQTIARAIVKVCDEIYILNATVIIHLANGTYPEFICLRDYQNILISTSTNDPCVLIEGDVVDPSNVVIQPIGSLAANSRYLLNQSSSSFWGVGGIEMDMTLVTGSTSIVVGLQGLTRLELYDYNITLPTGYIGTFYLVRYGGILHTQSYQSNPGDGGTVRVSGDQVATIYDTHDGVILDESVYDFLTANFLFTVAVFDANFGLVADRRGGAKYLGTFNAASKDFRIQDYMRIDFQDPASVIPGAGNTNIIDETCSINGAQASTRISGAPSASDLHKFTYTVFKDIGAGAGSGVVLGYNDNGTLVTFSPGGGSGTPGGNDTNIQFNNTGAFDGSDDLTWITTGLTNMQHSSFGNLADLTAKNAVLSLIDTSTTDSSMGLYISHTVDGVKGFAENINIAVDAASTVDFSPLTGLYFSIYDPPGSTSVINFISGIAGEVFHYGDSAGTIVGNSIYVDVSAAVSNAAFGYLSQPSINVSIPKVIAIDSNIGHFSGTITDCWGLRINTADFFSTITNMYGIDIQPHTIGATLSYNLISRGDTTRNLFEGYVEVKETATPPGTVTNVARIFAVDNGSGKTKLMVQFGSGAAQQIAIEP